MRPRFTFLTIFPEIFHVYLSLSIWEKAISKGLVEVKVINIRDYAIDKHKTVDDKPFGGGAGMLFKFEPVYSAVLDAKKHSKRNVVILLSASGGMVTPQFVRALAQKTWETKANLIFIAPRYEGVDARIEEFVDIKVSVAPVVVTGGELPALLLADAIVRFIPGVLGNPASLEEETSYIVKEGNLFVRPEYPQYTRPRRIKVGTRVLEVPQVLLEGDHGRIREWRDRFSNIRPVSFLGEKDVERLFSA